VGLNIKPRPYLIFQPEIRYDYFSGDARPFEGKHWLFTAATNMIVRF
jgi:hypothetical protein